jgi:N6-adenosine-specific RNA methylase IME4
MGFKYATIGFVWVKTCKDGITPRMNYGWWSCAGSELCLLATKGSPSPQARDVWPVVPSPQREHSRKPDIIYDTHIPRLCLGPYVELFARTRRPGWDIAFSDQPDKFTNMSNLHSMSDVCDNT